MDYYPKTNLRNSELKESTQLEVNDMLDAEMTQLTPSELNDLINPLGYSISKTPMTFNYVNTGNKRHYKAKSVHIKVTGTDLSFANIKADRTNLKALQDIRFNCFVFTNGRIWEI